MRAGRLGALPAADFSFHMRSAFRSCLGMHALGFTRAINENAQGILNFALSVSHKLDY